MRTSMFRAAFLTLVAVAFCCLVLSARSQRATTVQSDAVAEAMVKAVRDSHAEMNIDAFVSLEKDERETLFPMLRRRLSTLHWPRPGKLRPTEGVGKRGCSS
ncbi:MAG: hypothetical protein M3410_16595 [Acidobacteriota bacterium]|nr:hypothetical protein [Acidobacteriota bacterium]